MAVMIKRVEFNFSLWEGMFPLPFLVVDIFQRKIIKSIDKTARDIFEGYMEGDYVWER